MGEGSGVQSGGGGDRNKAVVEGEKEASGVMEVSGMEGLVS